MRKSLLLLTSITFLTWIGTRMTAVALPLLALSATGEAWTTGLVGGVAGLPLLTVGWWGRSLRDRITSGRALAILMLMQALGLVIVPIASVFDVVGAVALCLSGLVTGVAGALLAPAQRAIVADLADAGTEMGAPSTAPQWLVWQDLAHRISMIFAPPAGAWLVVVWGAQPLLWLESALFLLGALAMLAVPSTDRRSADLDEKGAASHGTAISFLGVLQSHPQIAVGIVLAGIGGLCWFGFSLGLAVLGYELGMPGVLIAAGMSGYGFASIITTFLIPTVINRLPRMPMMVTAWSVLGLTFVSIPLVAPSLVGIAAVAAVGGAAMPWGIAALNALISEQTNGAERRAAFAAETVLHSGGASLGLLFGGAVIGWAGAGPVLIATGLIQILAALVGLGAAARPVRSLDPEPHKLTGVRSPS